MKILLHKGLILDVGRADSPGRPFLCATTPELLQHFMLSSIDELPPLDEEQTIPGISEPIEEL